jgi:hypothetical protein
MVDSIWLVGWLVGCYLVGWLVGWLLADSRDPVSRLPGSRQQTFFVAGD